MCLKPGANENDFILVIPQMLTEKEQKIGSKEMTRSKKRITWLRWVGVKSRKGINFCYTFVETLHKQ